MKVSATVCTVHNSEAGEEESIWVVLYGKRGTPQYRFVPQEKASEFGFGWCYEPLQFTPGHAGIKTKTILSQSAALDFT